MQESVDPSLSAALAEVGPTCGPQPACLVELKGHRETRPLVPSVSVDGVSALSHATPGS